MIKLIIIELTNLVNCSQNPDVKVTTIVDDGAKLRINSSKNNYINDNINNI